MTNKIHQQDPLFKEGEAFKELEEIRFKAEVYLADKYQSFVAEPLCLSLLGIAVFGFLCKEIFMNLCYNELMWVIIAKILGAWGNQLPPPEEAV